MASSADTAGKERRREERFRRSVPLRVGHDSVDGVRAESINISTRGLYCKVTRYVQPFSKTKVCLELPFVARDPESMECDGVVVRVEPDVEAPGIDEYRLAIYFLNLGHRQAELIEDFLAEAH
ncbi:MAG: PilZ domain-containing protein [Deferrisomatales bacterium]|nr:PilZ domain-containing protein [Deferrisomatales bacterium]